MEAGFSILSTAILLFFILDPFGNIPLLLSVLKEIPKERHSKVIVRELFIGFLILLVFLFFGEEFLNVFHLQTQAISIAGAIIFFVIALKMIFPSPSGEGIFTAKKGEEPLVVPIAMPMIAGPAALATILVLAKAHSENGVELFISLTLAWGLTFIVLFFSPLLYKVLRTKGLTALERLMGMLLLIMAVQMFIDGIRELLPTLGS